MKSGLWIGVPLTVLRYACHPHLPVDPIDVANNFAVAHAIYDADRIDAPALSSERDTTRICAALSAGYYASLSALPLSLLVLALHFGYKESKPVLGPVKPFFVSACWTMCIFFTPAASGSDLFLPAALFLALSSLSHAADLPDREEDAQRGILTPAVTMRDPELYAVALMLSACYLHSCSPSPSSLVDAFGLASLSSLLFTGTLLPAWGIGMLFSAAYADANDVELFTRVLRASESSHKFAIEWATSTIQWAFTLPDVQRQLVVDLTTHVMQWGDSVGSGILRAYEAAIRDRLTSL